MGKASVEMKWEFPDLLAALEGAKERIEQEIVSAVQTQVGLRFDNEGAYHGHERWAPLKSRQGQILSLTGTLRKSISPPSSNGKAGPEGFVTSQGDPQNLLVEVGTKVIYSSIHNNGGKIKFPGTENGFGRKIKIPAHSIPIPRRNFTDQNDQDSQEIAQSMANVIANILSGAS